MPIIRPAGNGRELVMAGWGLIPFWLKKESLGKQPYSTINARAETIRTAPIYRGYSICLTDAGRRLVEAS